MKNRLLILSLVLLLVLAGCGGGNQGSLSNEESHVVLQEAVTNLRHLNSFRIDVTQGGTPYLFYFQLGLAGEAVVALTRAEGAFIAPDNLYASAAMAFGNDIANISLFANSSNQWIKPLALNWFVYEYAPGFNPLDVMGEGTGFNYAVDNLTELQFVAYESHNGLETIHLHANASRDVVNALLFGLLYIAEEQATVDFFIDVDKDIIAELVLTLPGTRTASTEDTFWQIEIYDHNQQIEVDTPPNVVAVVPETAPLPDEFNWRIPFFWTMGLSGVLGAVVTPFLYRRKGRSAANGLVVGGFLGLIGSLVALIPLWLFLPPMPKHEEEVEKPEITSHRMNPWLVMAFVALPVFVGSLDLTVVSAFLPELVYELGLPVDSGLDDASWVVTIYLLAYTVSLTFTGRLSDLWGRRSVYLGSLFIFIFGSIWVALALAWPSDILLTIYRLVGARPDPSHITLQAIIIGRGIQAFGAGALVPVSLALVGDIFPADKRAQPLGFVAAMDTLGWVLGPVYGGIFMQFMPWQGLFWLNVPLSLISLLALVYALHGVAMHKTRGIFDMLGTVLIVGALAAMTIGLGGNIDPAAAASIEDLQALPPYAGPVLGAALGLFLLFILVESRLKDPIVNLKMFTRRNLSAAALVNLIVGYCLFIGLVSVPILINLRLQDSSDFTQAALQVGIMLSTLTLPMAFAAVPGGWFSEHFGVRQTILFGLLLSITGFVLIWRTWTLDIADWYLGVQMALVGTGIGLTFSPVSAAIINSATEDERGVAGAIVLILRLIGMTISISSLSSVMLFRVNTLVRDSGLTEFDLSVIQVYTDAVVKVLGEMGLIGALLCIAALIPAFFIDKVVEAPVEE